MKRISSIMFCAILALLGMTILSTSAEAKTKKPRLTVGPGCGSGAARTYPWTLDEDRDGDGVYDYRTIAACDGTVVHGPINGSVSPLGQLPVGPTINYTYYTETEMPSGQWSWAVHEYAGGTTPVCVTGRDADDVLSSSCQGGGGLE